MGQAVSFVFFILIMNKTFTKTVVIFIGSILSAITAIGILLFFDPRKVEWLPKCAFFQITRLHCPGCGNTRALYHLIHGEFLQSVRNNCLLIPAIITLIILLIFPRLTLEKFVCYTILIVIVLFFVLRNIPFFPFTLLAPV